VQPQVTAPINLAHRLGTAASGNSSGPVSENKKRPQLGGVLSEVFAIRFLTTYICNIVCSAEACI
jgi:hypothetical protein